MKIFHLRVITGNTTWPMQVRAEGLRYGSVYEFYVGEKCVAFYPTERTIIERIEEYSAEEAKVF